MYYIQREIDLIYTALRDSPEGSDRAALYAAQQALSWATEPDGFKSPTSLLMGTQEEITSCSAYPRQGVS